jgi:lipopolysaccharide export system protein LptC
MNADRLRSWLFIAILAIVTLGSFWVYEVMRREAEQKAQQSTVRVAPDYYVDQFSYVRFDEQGKANYRMTGERLIHHPKDDQIEIIQPRLNALDASLSKILLRADRSIILQANSKKKTVSEDQIHFFGNIFANKEAGTNNPAWNFKTEFLLVLPDSNVMTTDKQVEFISNGSRIQANSMMANHKEQKYEFSGNVNMSLAPKENSSKHK